MQYYVIGSSYADDQFEYAHILRSSREDARDVAEILTAVQSYYEEMIGRTKTPDMEGLMGLLVQRFGFRETDKEMHLMELNEILNYTADMIDPAYEEFEFEEYNWTYLDRNEAGRALCPGADTLELYKKWLTPLIKSDIKRIDEEA